MPLKFDDRTLLRGASAAALVCNNSAIFEASSLTAAELAVMHKATTEVETLDVFVSHSWRTPRSQKLVALLLYLNANAAITAMLLSSITLVLLENAGVVPMIAPVHIRMDTWDGADRSWRMTGMPQLVGWLAAIVCLRYWQEIAEALAAAGVPLRRRFCFLDKLCIDQSDEQRKSRGIASLGAFLAHSKTMLVLFAPEYFSRLWCCFELAAFHKVQSREQAMVFLPVSFPRFLASVFLLQTVAMAATLLVSCGQSEPDCFAAATTISLTFVAGLPFAVREGRRYHAERKAIDAQIVNFSLDRAECFEPKDRVRIERNIAEWFGGGDRERGIASFNRHVRSEMRRTMEAVVGAQGRLSIPYKYCFLAAMPNIMNDLGGLSQVHTYSWPTNAGIVMSNFSCCVLWAPMTPVMILWIASWGVWEQGLLSQMAGAVTAAAVASASLFTVVPQGMVFANSEASILRMALTLACFSLPLSVWVFRDSVRREARYRSD